MRVRVVELCARCNKISALKHVQDAGDTRDEEGHRRGRVGGNVRRRRNLAGRGHALMMSRIVSVSNSMLFPVVTDRGTVCPRHPRAWG
jgi:hypothetical protein